MSECEMDLVRLPLVQLRAIVCDAAAQLMLENGVDALSQSAVAHHAGLGKGQVNRAYSNRMELAAGIYRHAHTRVETACSRHPGRGASGVEAVIALAYDLVEQAEVDPLAQALHVLEGTEHAAEIGSDSIYRVWERQFTELLIHGGELGPDELVADADPAQVVEIVKLLVDSIAGFSRPRLPDVSSDDRLDRLHMVLTAVLPTLCLNARHSAYLRQYLARVHDYASVGAR